jgi:hypothetical protein
MIDYKTIKRMAKEHGISVNDLCALAAKNDPFYTGRPSEMAAAEWFAGLWWRFGYGTGVHLRRVHYQIVSQDTPITYPHRDYPDGKPYENTERDWGYLCEAGKWARYLDLVSPEAFEDRRNPEAIINARWKNPDDWSYEDPTPGYKVVQGDWDYELPGLPKLEGLPGELPDLPDFEVTGYTNGWSSLVQQSYHVEVWAEKTTMNDILEPLCRDYNVNLVTGAGEMSITSVVDFMDRVREARRPARILYVSDYDPAGLGMPISVARKIEFFQRQNGDGGLDIRLHPIVLTADQVEEYSLPRVPVKDSDLRKAGWEAHHGKGQTELDALEALYPGKLAEIVKAAILDYYDPDLDSKTREAKEELETDLADRWAEVLEVHQDDLDDIGADYDNLVWEMDALRERFAELVEPFREEIGAYQERLDDIRQRWQRLVEGLVDDLKEMDVDLDDYPLPEPDLPEENDGLLYVSGRDYLVQLEHYQAYREGG